jgi:hypothetical protein
MQSCHNAVTIYRALDEVAVPVADCTPLSEGFCRSSEQLELAYNVCILSVSSRPLKGFSGPIWMLDRRLRV